MGNGCSQLLEALKLKHPKNEVQMQYHQQQQQQHQQHDKQLRPRIAVAGAGISGLSTALRILQTLPQAEVTIYTEHVTPDTTSDVAAGFWAPSFISNTPQDLIISWGKETFDFLANLALSDPQSGNFGVFLSPGFELFTVEDPGTRYWSHIPIDFRRATPRELAMFPSKIKSGLYYVTVVTEGSKFLPHLMDQFKALGGKLVGNFRIESFSQLHKMGYSHIVNCTGLGAMRLCQDNLMFPIRGQVHRVQAPWLKFWYISEDNGTYCLLNTDHAVLGGVAQRGNWNTAISQQDKQSILSRNYATWPALRGAPVEQDLAGLRPGRDRVRLERQVVKEGDHSGQEFTIYHNYGHGGSGLTLFWGCAGSVAEMLRQDLQAMGTEPGAPAQL